ncbi:ABC transporter substrate-binding protein [Niallia oryzisoli]|uniref:ABC transporter substrate-binding protein n=1 Tax=Niallia oryzisoli TaxID=1737571 RepID=UPI0037353DFF
MKKKSRFLLGLLITMIISVLLAGCSSDTKTASGKTQKDNKTITVNVAINGKIGPLLIAKEKGWLEEEFKTVNAEVAWSEFPSGPPLLESLASNRVDISALGDGALIAGLDKKLPFEVIAQSGTGESLSRILVQADGDIQKVEDLKGKTVGVASGTTAHVYLIKALKAHGLSTDDVKLINLQPDDAQAAFETKQLDAWVVWNPYRILNIKKGIAKELEVNATILAPSALITRTEFGKEHPEIVEAYLRVSLKAAQWQNENPDEAAKIFSEHTKLPVDVVKTIITSEKPDLFFTEEGIQAQQESIETLAKVGYIKSEFTFEDHINDSYIDNAFKK